MRAVTGQLNLVAKEKRSLKTALATTLEELDLNFTFDLCCFANMGVLTVYRCTCEYVCISTHVPFLLHCSPSFFTILSPARTTFMKSHT